jgi:hypothetical protein
MVPASFGLIPLQQPLLCLLLSTGRARGVAPVLWKLVASSKLLRRDSGAIDCGGGAVSLAARWCFVGNVCSLE